MQVQTHIVIQNPENLEQTAQLVIFETSILSKVRCESFHVVMEVIGRGLLYT